MELLGHRKLAGKVSEVERFGVKMGRIDIPTEDGFMTQFFGGGSVYSMSIVTEAVARQVVKSAPSAQPVHAWDFPKQLAAAHPPGGRFDDDGVFMDNDEFEDHDS